MDNGFRTGYPLSMDINGRMTDSEIKALDPLYQATRPSAEALKSMPPGTWWWQELGAMGTRRNRRATFYSMTEEGKPVIFRED